MTTIMSEAALSEIRDKLYQLAGDVAATRATLEGLRQLIAERATRIDAQDERIRKLETHNAHHVGSTSVIGSAAGVIAGGLAAWLVKHF